MVYEFQFVFRLTLEHFQVFWPGMHEPCLVSLNPDLFYHFLYICICFK